MHKASPSRLRVLLTNNEPEILEESKQVRFALQPVEPVAAAQAAAPQKQALVIPKDRIVLKEQIMAVKIENTIQASVDTSLGGKVSAVAAEASKMQSLQSKSAHH